MTEAQTILKLVGDRSRVQVVSGFFRGLEGARASVDFNDGRVPAYFATPWRPEVNEPVWVMVTDGVAYLLGPTSAKPAVGVVVSVSGGRAVVSTDIGQVTATYDLPRTYSAGDKVRLSWNSGCWIDGIRSDVPPDPDVPPAPGGEGKRQTRRFTAIDSGSYQSGHGWRINDVWCSASNIGAWFYGTKIRDTIPDGATIHSAQIYLPQRKNLGAAPFGRHGSATKPVGPVSFAATAELPARSGWVSIPTSLIDYLKANTGGLGFAGGGYSIWSGTQRDGQSGTVRVTYTS